MLPAASEAWCRAQPCTSMAQQPRAAISVQDAPLPAPAAPPPPLRLPPLAVHARHGGSEPSTPLGGIPRSTSSMGTSPKLKSVPSLERGGSTASPMSRQGSGAVCAGVGRSALPPTACLPPAALLVEGLQFMTNQCVLAPQPSAPPPLLQASQTSCSAQAPAARSSCRALASASPACCTAATAPTAAPRKRGEAGTEAWVVVGSGGIDL